MERCSGWRFTRRRERLMWPGSSTVLRGSDRGKFRCVMQPLRTPTSRWWPRSRVAHMVKSFGRRGTATVHADPPDLVSLLLATAWAAKIQLLSRAISPATAIASVITPLALATASLLLAGNDPGQR